VCETDYLFHLSGDTFIINNHRNWIGEAICIMNDMENIWDAHLLSGWWDRNLQTVHYESEINNFLLGYGYGFTDRRYLIRKKDFINPIYNEIHKIPLMRFPNYGGNSFEKRVDAYLRNHKKLSIADKYTGYGHRNFPRNWFSRKILRHFIVYARIGEMESKRHILFLMRVARKLKKILN